MLIFVAGCSWAFPTPERDRVLSVPDNEEYKRTVPFWAVLTSYIKLKT
jgi:hypothetical protein